ncbi:hypothetical protein B0T22DRAFT_466616 [Podospora appendiculata]|uniref:Uncharacterized protein n=1 Tax=Podospora appendiculata TaxID=314037 RepID=A0AAE0X646_9PEZI|nr:hypothetical protein B0T22DRAFT_466616 [Podospora appendiculata]
MVDRKEWLSSRGLFFFFLFLSSMVWSDLATIVRLCGWVCVRESDTPNLAGFLFLYPLSHARSILVIPLSTLPIRVCVCVSPLFSLFLSLSLSLLSLTARIDCGCRRD